MNPDRDRKYYYAIALTLKAEKVSSAYLQRTMKIGFNHAARLIEEMARDGIVSEPDEKTGKRTIILN